MTAFNPGLPCALYPRACGAVRAKNPGLCDAGAQVRVALAQLHHGEEPCLSGSGSAPGGRGVIFFSGCTLRCAYCQNHDISIRNVGHDLSVEDLTALMLNCDCSVQADAYAAVRSHMEGLGFSLGFVQRVGSSAAFTPNFHATDFHATDFRPE